MSRALLLTRLDRHSRELKLPLKLGGLTFILHLARRERVLYSVSVSLHGRALVLSIIREQELGLDVLHPILPTLCKVFQGKRNPLT